MTPLQNLTYFQESEQPFASESENNFLSQHYLFFFFFWALDAKNGL